MAVFKIKCDRCYETWWRDFYEIEAPTIEDAVEIIKTNSVEPYDTELLIDLNQQDPIKMEMFDEYGECIDYSN